MTEAMNDAVDVAVM